jgi:hypothetical protein
LEPISRPIVAGVCNFEKILTERQNQEDGRDFFIIIFTGNIIIVYFN